ncbi:cytochrome P450 [Schizopora paradoxa]|uniref:Cytochrome P450 n=1 Tax=Schizopora paradoxa TaxID=27342 RepID=A0A0H2RUS4_9AGAM|nr:cytochrome P450 [Schizopora paradoxa]
MNVGSTQISTTIAFAALFALAFKLASRKKYPPGPKPLPLIGNLKDLPTSFEWETYAEWAKKYGDVMHLQVFGSSILILSSVRAAKDLLESRSSIYSCRPKFTMIHDLMGWDWAVQFMQFGPRFKTYRKAVQNQLTPQATLSLRPTLEKSTRSLIESIKSDPSAFLTHIKNMTGEMMISTIYGEQEAGRCEEYIHNAEEAISGLLIAGNFGKFLVDILPALKYIPAWFPGASFQRKAEEWKKSTRKMIDIPYTHVAGSLDADESSPSIIRSMLLESDRSGFLDEELIKGTGGVLYLGGADTMLSILLTFVFAMLQYPEIQKRAQTEIDQVIGARKRPTLDDKPSLPFVKAIYLESLRWHPSVPLGVPHRLMDDDSYRGYDIPAGATVLVNQWAIFRDEANYKNASAFDPSRFLEGCNDKPILDPTSVAFGFGRRRCPGRHFAEDSVWLVMASILAEFDITYAKDKDGNDIPPTEKFISSLVSRPEPFEALFVPRCTAQLN